MPWIFNGLYAVALIIASPWLIYRSISTGRYRQGWREKLLGRLPESVVSERNAADANSPVIWLHGVSVGEVQLLKPLVEQLRRRLPLATLVLSTTTETGMELACKIMADVPRFYFPLDFTWSTRNVLQTIQPTMIVLGELELWPNLVNEAHARGIPIMVLNARLSEKSFVGYRRFRWLTEPMFAKLRLVAAQDATYADRFIRCGVPSDRVRITGCTKFDNVQFDNTIEPVLQLRNLVGLNDQHTVWIFGSTQSPEEQRAGRCFFNCAINTRNLD